MYKSLIKPVLFLFPPEKAHAITVFAWRFLSGVPVLSSALKSWLAFEHPALEKTVFGIKFPNPIGLAAGFDKDGKYFKDMSKLGFGFIEIGTVTPKPQPGNPQPRLFRLPADQALINRMGFNNDGVEELAQRLKNHPSSGIIIGGNIGKNKDTPNEQAINDYLICLRTLYPYVDYFVVNVSSPNTPGLRELQEKEPLTNLLKTLKEEIQHHEVKKPLLLKIAPDLTDSQLDDIVDIILTTRTDGVIATNTTIARSNLHSDTSAIGAGGLSGLPLKDRSTEVIRYLVKKSNGKIPVIGVGGIFSARDAREKLDAGASLVQVYTGLIYEGPFMIRNIKKNLLAK